MRNPFKYLAATLLLSSLPALSHAATPGMRGVDHFGFTVPDLEQAVGFLVEVMGCEAFFTIGPFGPFEDDWMAENLNVNPRASIPVAHMVRCANGTNFEIFDYDSPDQRLEQPRNSDIGGHHIAFYVDDMDEAVTYMKDKGVPIPRRTPPVHRRAAGRAALGLLPGSLGHADGTGECA